MKIRQKQWANYSRQQSIFKLNLPAGVYIANLQSEKTQYARKIIIQ
ncbi:MAG: T9SS type A sorting domain-containing protein [Chitinophagales bacterium]|nr:T9SS type A sorting domain-containing protein [Chitinophagales bacterium]